MHYLQVLDTIRSITGSRRYDRFPPIQPPVIVLRPDGGVPSTFVVCDAQQAKAVLQSPRYRQFNFLEQILTIAKPDRTVWIRRFCDVGLIMVDGPEHQRRRLLMQQDLERCTDGVRAIPPEELIAAIEEGLGAAPCTAAAVASRLVAVLFSRSIAMLTGHAAELPPEDLFAIDFFNPFPTISSLSRCNDSIDRCCQAIGFDSLDESGQAAVLSLLLMGVSPLHALLTVMLDVHASAQRDGLTADEAARHTEEIDSYAVVPTNFVMRACVAADTIGAEDVKPGDIVYLFLGSATGCPFSRRTSIPFGAGRHYCSGAALTQVMTTTVRSSLAHSTVDCSRITPSPELEGKALAFLAFAAAP